MNAKRESLRRRVRRPIDINEIIQIENSFMFGVAVNFARTNCPFAVARKIASLVRDGAAVVLAPGGFKINGRFESVEEVAS